MSDFNSKGWWGFDLDGTLVKYEHWVHATHIGEVVGKGETNPESAYEKLKRYLKEGRGAKIVTARVYPLGLDKKELLASGAFGDAEDIASGVAEAQYEARLEQAKEAEKAIRQWSKGEFGVEVPAVCYKDFAMITLFDDRATTVGKNTGIPWNAKRKA